LADLEELERKAAEKAAAAELDDVEFEDADDGDDDSEEEHDNYSDLVAANNMLVDCITMLNYMSNPDLCKTVTMRERNNMARFAKKVLDFVNMVDLSEE
jgi:hypothetical protein